MTLQKKKQNDNQICNGLYNTDVETVKLFETVTIINKAAQILTSEE